MPALTPDVVETYRSLAMKLLHERYADNQSAFARDLGIRSTNIKRFVIDHKGGISGVTAQKLSKLAAIPYPLPEKMKSVAPPPVVASSRRPVATDDAELEKTIDYWQTRPTGPRWPVEVIEIARLMAIHRGVRKTRDEWVEVIEAIEECISDFVNKTK